MTTQEQILEIIRQVIGDIYSDVGSVGDLFSNGVKTDLIEAIFARLDELGFTLSDLFPRAVAESYAAGIQSGNALMIEAGIGAASLGTATAAATIKRRIHLEAIDFLISGGMQDLRTAINTAKINAVDTIDNALDAVKRDWPFHNGRSKPKESERPCIGGIRKEWLDWIRYIGRKTAASRFLCIDGYSYKDKGGAHWRGRESLSRGGSRSCLY